jgi:hypothetical protein
MNALRLCTIVLLGIGLTACNESNTPDPAVPADAAAHAGAAATTPSPLAGLSKNVVADNVQFQPEAAKVEGNALVSTGVPGFVMYGPYVSFAPGNYHVNVQGSIRDMRPGAQVRFDAVSGAAATVHGEQVVTAAVPDAGTIASFDISVPEGVTDLEVRAQVTEGVDMRIESYQVKAD